MVQIVIKASTSIYIGGHELKWEFLCIYQLKMKQEPVIYENSEALSSNFVTQVVNQFLVQYSKTLITCSATCEEKLLSLNTKLTKLEAALTLLEKKLEPFSAGADEQIQQKVEPETTTNLTYVAPKEEINKVDDNKFVEETLEVENEILEEVETDRLRIKDAPQLQTYFKMLKMGVPHEAVKLKMARENIDASLLDRPDDFYE